MADMIKELEQMKSFILGAIVYKDKMPFIVPFSENLFTVLNDAVGVSRGIKYGVYDVTVTGVNTHLWGSEPFISGELFVEPEKKENG